MSQNDPLPGESAPGSEPATPAVDAEPSDASDATADLLIADATVSAVGADHALGAPAGEPSAVPEASPEAAPEAAAEVPAAEMRAAEAPPQAGPDAEDRSGEAVASGPELPRAADPLAVPSANGAAEAPTAAAPANVPELSPAAVAALLAGRFPALFGAGRALPIKLRIQADIQQRAPGEFTKKALSIFLHRYTTSTAYLRALAQSPHRFDLDGAPAGEVADEHRQAAAAEAERRRLIVLERRAAERQAQRPPQAPRRDGSPRPVPRAAAAEGTAPDAGERAEPGSAATQATHVARTPPQQVRPDGAQRPARADRPAQGRRADPRSQTARPGHADGARGPAPAEAARGPARPRAESDAGQRRGDRAPRPPLRELPTPQGRRQDVATEARPPAPAAATPPPGPALSAAEFEARRERATLLRAFETTTLTTVNFCALKGIKPATLEPLLALARQERGERPAEPGRPGAPPGGGFGPANARSGERRPDAGRRPPAQPTGRVKGQ